MLREVIRWLDLSPGLVVVDGTIGAGGHSAAILPLIRPEGHLIGLDRDPMMLAHAKQAVVGNDVDMFHSCYSDLRVILEQVGRDSVDRVLLDLGLSSDQLADVERGFSFQAEGSLDLRFDVTKGRPAAEALAAASATELARLFKEFGEEPYADRIAEAIVKFRSISPLRTARDLGELVERTVPVGGRRGGVHPATRIFQALRIAANSELAELRRMLYETLPSCLAPGGRAAIISFHSLEDRMVKDAFRDKELWNDLMPKPLAATPSEARINPRARSARIRAAIRK